MRYPLREVCAAAIIPRPLVTGDDIAAINGHLHGAGQSRRERPSAVERNGHYACIIGPDVDLLAHDLPLVSRVAPRRHERADRRSHQVLQPFVQLCSSTAGQEKGGEYRNYCFHAPLLSRPAIPQRAFELKRQRNHALPDSAEMGCQTHLAHRLDRLNP